MKRKYALQLFAGAVIRNKIADYIDVSNTTTPDYKLMGTGFTSLNEEAGAQSDTVTYVNEVTGSSDITGYETEFGYESHLIPDQDAILLLYKDGRDHHTGADAQHKYVRVELWNPLATQVQDKEEYSARLFTTSNEVSSYEGDGGEKITVSGTLKAVGDPIVGKFDILSKTFTEGTFTFAYDV